MRSVSSECPVIHIGPTDNCIWEKIYEDLEMIGLTETEQRAIQKALES